VSLSDSSLLAVRREDGLDETRQSVVLDFAGGLAGSRLCWWMDMSMLRQSLRDVVVTGIRSEAEKRKRKKERKKNESTADHLLWSAAPSLRPSSTGPSQRPPWFRPVGRRRSAASQPASSSSSHHR